MQKTVYLGMIGDIMHPGLINIINEGAKYGEVMIGLFTDKAIATHRRLPYLNYEQRKNVIENIKGVSKVVPQDEWSYVENLKKAGIEAEMDAYPDWFHAYDLLFPMKKISREAIGRFEHHFAYALEHYFAPQPPAEEKLSGGKPAEDMVE